MSQVLLLNPRRRRRMPPGLRRYWAAKRRGRASNPRRRRHRARASNPRRRSRRRAFFMSNPRRRSRRSHARRYYRNPRSRGGGSFTPGQGSVGAHYIIPALIGGIGAVAFDVAWGYGQQYVPASLQSGWVGTIVEAAAIWLVLAGVRKYAPRHFRTASAAGAGAATVLAYNALKGIAQQVLPSGTPGLSGYMPSNRYPLGRIGAYQVRPLGDYYSPAAVVQSPVPRQFGALQPHIASGGGNFTPQFDDGM
jgi:hypothetical protein